jgi:hypothetical protein
MPLPVPEVSATGVVLRTHFTTMSFTYVDNERGKVFRTSTHGGKILGNICQSSGACIQSQWMKNASNEGLLVSIHVHDQLVVECKKEDIAHVNETLTRCLPGNYDPSHWTAGFNVSATPEYEYLDRFWK